MPKSKALSEVATLKGVIDDETLRVAAIITERAATKGIRRDTTHISYFGRRLYGLYELSKELNDLHRKRVQTIPVEIKRLAHRLMEIPHSVRESAPSHLLHTMEIPLPTGGEGFVNEQIKRLLKL